VCRSILVAVNRNSSRVDAIETAFVYGEQFDAEIDVLYVVSTSLPRTSWAAEIREQYREEILDEIDERAGDHDISVDISIRMGNLGRAVRSYVDEQTIDLVIVGVESRSSLGRLLLRENLVDQLAADISVPVMAVPTGH